MFRQIMALVYIFLVFVVRVLYFDYHSVETGPFSNEVMRTIENAPILVNIIQSDVALKIYLVTAIAPGVLLFLGIFPSLSSFMAMIFYIILARRYFPYYYGTDELMVSILFVMGFFYLLKNKDEGHYISVKNNPFILLLLLQITIVYCFNGLNKTHVNWWNGEAVSMALFNVQFNKPLGIYFLKFEWLNKFLTYFTLIFEISFPLWIFSVYKQKVFRVFAGVFILLFHWGINMFADVTLYKFTGLAFFFLLMPSEFWNKFKWLNNLLVPDIKVNFKDFLNLKYAKILTFSLSLLLLFKAVNASVHRQNLRYKFIKNESLRRVNELLISTTYSPLRQYWFMFAPSPPEETGYFSFEYTDTLGTRFNANIYNDEMPNKKFPYYHPVHVCSIIQYANAVKGVLPKETEFVLISLFMFDIKNNILQHPERSIDNFELVMYKQSYDDFKKSKLYKFERIILAKFE